MVGSRGASFSKRSGSVVSVRKASGTLSGMTTSRFALLAQISPDPAVRVIRPTPARRAAMVKPSWRAECDTVPTASSPKSPWTVPLHAVCSSELSLRYLVNYFTSSIRLSPKPTSGVRGQGPYPTGMNGSAPRCRLVRPLRQDEPRSDQRHQRQSMQNRVTQLMAASCSFPSLPHDRRRPPRTRPVGLIRRRDRVMSRLRGVSEQVASPGAADGRAVPRVEQGAAPQRETSAADATGQFISKLLQVGNLALETRAPGSRESLPVCLGRRPSLWQTCQRSPDLLQRETNGLSGPDHCHRPERCAGVSPLVARGPCRGDQPARFVEAERRRCDAAPGRHLADRQIVVFRCHLETREYSLDFKFA